MEQVVLMTVQEMRELVKKIERLQRLADPFTKSKDAKIRKAAEEAIEKNDRLLAECHAFITRHSGPALKN